MTTGKPAIGSFYRDEESGAFHVYERDGWVMLPPASVVPLFDDEYDNDTENQYWQDWEE